MTRNNWSNTQRSWLLTGFPFTVALMVLKLVSLFFTTVPSLGGFLGHLIFVAPDGLKTPWTILTYAIVTGGPFFSFLFNVGLTYWFCSSLERSWGTKNFALFFAAVTAVTALSLSLGAFLLHREFFAENLLPVAACALAWGLVNGDEAVTLFFIPMRGIHMALVAVGYVMFQYAGSQSPIAFAQDGALGRVAFETSGWWAVPFALVGCALAWLWIRNGWQYGFGTLLPGVSRHQVKRPPLRLVPSQPKTPKPKDDRFTLRDLNPLEMIAKRRRRKQFEKLMNDD
jgi:hypothetical protein